MKPADPQQPRRHSRPVHATLKSWRNHITLGLMAALACLVGTRPTFARDEPDRSPVDLVLSADESWLISVNQTAHTISLVNVDLGRVVQELPVAHRPAGIALAPDGKRLVVTSTDAGTASLFELTDGSLTAMGSVQVGFEPVGIAISPDGGTAYAALQATAEVAVIDLDQQSVVERIGVGSWPRHLALSPDGSRLAVGTSGDQSISVVDTASRKLLYQEKFGGINAGHLQVSADNQFVYFPWMIYRHNPVTERNIQLGWVLGTRIARIRLDGPARRQAMTLDPRGRAVSDPYGIGITPDEQWLVSSAAGTHELLVYRLPGLVFQDHGGPGDHIDPVLLNDDKKFFRVELSGRPMGLRISRDNRRVFVANYLLNCIQVVDLDARAVTSTIDLGGPDEPSLARRGEAIFYDGGRSLDQWYSCHSCHYEGGTNAVPMDTMNDGSIRTFKSVLPLRNVTRTAPWTWHGWQTDLTAAMHKSMTETMLGREPHTGDIEALIAWLDTLETPTSPFRGPDGSLSESARRGEAVFNSEKAGCSTCHNGPYFTDGQIHDVGLGSAKDEYQGYNTPSLVGVYGRIRLLHDGRAKSLGQLLTGPHNPAKVTGLGELTDEERADLIEYLKSL